MFPLRAAVFGLGKMGKVHLRNLIALGVSIEAICDPNNDQIETAKREVEIDGLLSFTDSKKLIEQCNFDVAVVATTTDARFSTLYSLLKDSKCQRILIEKPLCQNSSQLNYLETLVHSRPEVAIAVNHQMRFMPQYSEIKKLIESREFGSLNSMLVAGSNFGLGMNVTHYFEAFRWLTDTDELSINAVLETNSITSPRGAGFEDYAGWLIATNESDQHLNVSFPSNSGHGLLVTYDFDYAKIVIDELTGWAKTTSRQKNSFAEPSFRYGLPSIENNWRVDILSIYETSMRVLQSFLEGHHYPTFSDAVWNSKYAFLCMLSAKRNGKQVHKSDLAGVNINSKWP